MTDNVSGLERGRRARAHNCTAPTTQVPSNGVRASEPLALGNLTAFDPFFSRWCRLNKIANRVRMVERRSLLRGPLHH